MAVIELGERTPPVGEAEGVVAFEGGVFMVGDRLVYATTKWKEYIQCVEIAENMQVGRDVGSKIKNACRL